MVRTKTCERCVFFCDFRSVADPDDMQARDGQCRRRTPIALLLREDLLETVWPEVDAGQWCGEFEAV